MIETSLDRYIYWLQLGIIYFEGSFSEGNDKRAVYEYEDTYTIAIEVDMSERLIRFWGHPQKRVRWEDEFSRYSYPGELINRLHNRYFPNLPMSQIRLELKKRY
ncbi:hypothetical protein [Streptococcus agalactiae]|uniref:hypothetical protein n=1 Tax=Streptococcus agalactiae TaxID=1311 RepID=UPI00059AF630|nr:hypothetical protein [Streptococcus agalactiae]